MKYTYQFISGVGVMYEGPTPPLTPTGVNNNPWACDELQGQPIFAGWTGPMYNGIAEDGSAIIRYETPEVYRALSI